MISLQVGLVFTSLGPVCVQPCALHLNERGQLCPIPWKQGLRHRSNNVARATAYFPYQVHTRCYGDTYTRKMPLSSQGPDGREIGEVTG